MLYWYKKDLDYQNEGTKHNYDNSRTFALEVSDEIVILQFGYT